MSRQIQLRRGTATEHESFIGAVGEITMDTTNQTLRVHDGETPGGVARHNGILVPKFAGNDTVGANNGVVGDNRIF